MPGGRFALIIGSDEYQDQGLRRLAAPSNDVHALAAALRDPDVGEFDVEVAVNEPSHQVRRRIEAFFRDRRRDDLLLLYFSGHGLKDELGRLFLAMTDTERHLLQATAVAAGFVQDAIEQTRSRRTVLLLDCCYGGAFAHGMGSKGDAAVHVNDGFGATGSVVLTSSNELEYAFEEDGLSGSGSASVFTRFLVDGLVSGAADGNGDGYIDLDELYGYVHDRVIEERPDQRPMRWNYGVQGRITVARNPHWELPQLIRDEMESPISASRVAAVRQLTQLCRVGSDVVCARAREALEQLIDHDSEQVCQAAQDALALLQPVSAGLSLTAVAVGAEALTPGEAPSPPPAEQSDRPAAPAVRPPGDVVVPRQRPGPSTPPQQPGRRIRLRPGLVIALAIVLVVSAVGTALARRGGSRGETVQEIPTQLPVPVVAGSGVDAVNALRAAGFDVRTTKVKDAHVPKGQVLRTDPQAGTSVLPHSVVTVVVSDGAAAVPVPTVSGTGTPSVSRTTVTQPPPVTVKVPSVQGLSEADARRALEQQGFRVQLGHHYNSDVGDGEAIGTVPAGGTEAQKGSTVTLDVSRGPKPQALVPTCSINPEVGGPGEAVEISCRGFASNDTVSAAWNGGARGSGTADGTGRVTVPATIPPGSRARHIPAGRGSWWSPATRAVGRR